MKTLTRIIGACLFTFLLGYSLSTATAGSGTSRDGVSTAFTPPEGKTGGNDTETTSRTVLKSVEIKNSQPESFRSSAPNIISRPEALTEVFDILCHSGRPLRVLQLGDSHVAGRVYPDAVRRTLEEAWGKSESDTVGCGITYEYFARNGATTQYFANEEWMRKIADAAPDLIILSFGTNECHSMKYNEEVHRRQLESFYAMLREASPSATVMLTTPPGDYLSSQRVSYVRRRGAKRRRVVRSGSRVNPMVERCANELERFGAEHGLAVWNLNAVAGGSDAAGNWTAARMMRPDRVHFTAEGYQLQGNLLGEAILKTYNQYITAQAAP